MLLGIFFIKYINSVNYTIFLTIEKYANLIFVRCIVCKTFHKICRKEVFEQLAKKLNNI